MFAVVEREMFIVVCLSLSNFGPAVTLPCIKTYHFKHGLYDLNTYTFTPEPEFLTTSSGFS